MPVSYSFPKNFTWGAATASYQIEGAAFEDDKGASVWDMMCRQEGRIQRNQNGDVACDHYHRYREDVALMKEMGLKAYRLSVSWPRVIPDGAGAVNAKGLDFYDRLTDELLAAGIEPWITLFHWDFPYALYCQGGWLNRQSPEWFARYTEVLVKKLSDRVNHWMTFNEPQCFIGLGHKLGMHAPGDKLGLSEVLKAAHHVLLSHGRAVQTIREHSQLAPVIGLASAGPVFIPGSDSPADIEVAREKMMGFGDEWTWNSTWWTDPIFLGHYPEDGLRRYHKEAPQVQPGDMEIIRQPLDFNGVNIYLGTVVRAGVNGAEVVKMADGWPMNTCFWEVQPKALYWGPRFLFERYKVPVVITENGLATNDWRSVDGQVHDPQRIDFLERYLSALGQAIRDGVDVRGYFLWSLMDNFEWAEGYRQRFGIIHTDYVTGARTMKDSARWYSQVIAQNGANLRVPFECVEVF